ncbi:DUF3572 family protein [Gemmobacter lutimaris]|uniref:DUF3572 family protein n=1 Tax=Gemmobacter lutimaris TaxID=2306023 RepID=A0A398BR13_9RHOB|nr:DUF3572 domain-containing protein [Gemmobacter lutimaris]RID91937.1 DUF3572 family protein [Gemmobacter lutimaris]
MAREAAETLAIRALGWLVSQEELLPGFLAATGSAPADLPARVADPEFLAAVMDFLLAEDAMVVAFCESAGLPYEAPMQARAALPGGDLPHWT